MDDLTISNLEKFRNWLYNNEHKIKMYGKSQILTILNIIRLIELVKDMMVQYNIPLDMSCKSLLVIGETEFLEVVLSVKNYIKEELNVMEIYIDNEYNYDIGYNYKLLPIITHKNSLYEQFINHTQMVSGIK